ncbi:hypothetical protein Acsp03_62690 [Actinomadura sp. NBRC 104412]|nr:hypothetical protein Acsp03_62690 [Actinomadura sp. NBRC 104412]
MVMLLTGGGMGTVLGMWVGTGGDGANHWMSGRPSCAIAACRGCAPLAVTVKIIGAVPGRSLTRAATDRGA